MLSATAGIPRKVVAWLAVMNWALTTLPCPSPTARAICSAFSTPMNGPLLAWSCLSGGKVEAGGCVAPGEGGGVYAANCALATAISATADAAPATNKISLSLDIVLPLTIISMDPFSSRAGWDEASVASPTARRHRCAGLQVVGTAS